MASRIDDRPGLVAALRAHAESTGLAALCRRVLDRIAESRSLGVSREFVAVQAEELGLGHEVVAEGVRVRAVLERGPESPEEWAIVVSFALCRIAVDLDTGDAHKARKFVREADVLESLGVDVLPFVEATMGASAVSAVLDAIVAETREDAARGRIGRARAYARVEALRSFADPGAERARQAVATILEDSPLANVLGPSGKGTSSVRFTARTRPVPRSTATYLLSLVTGLTFLRWVGRSFLALAGVRETAEVSVDASSITVASRTTFGERVLRSRTLRAPREGLLVATHATRYPAVRLLVGAVALSLGLVLGSVFVGDGVRSGETFLLLVGASLVLAGGVLDLLLSVAWPASKGHAALELVIAPRDVVSLVDVTDADALATLAWIRRSR